MGNRLKARALQRLGCLAATAKKVYSDAHAVRGESNLAATLVAALVAHFLADLAA